MSIDKLKGLQGLKGVGSLSKPQYDDFINSNRDLIAQHGYDPSYINNLYSNKQFIDRYGIDKFKAIPDIETRKALYKEDIVNTEFNKRYKPSRTNVGLGNDYDKYNQLSVDGKLKLMESNYLIPTELDKKVNNELMEDRRRMPKLEGGTHASMSFGDFLRAFGSAATKSPNAPAMEKQLQTDETKRQMAKEQNQRILDRIYNEDVDSQIHKFGSEVSTAYRDPYLSALSDEQVKEAFVQAITPNSYTDRNGLPNKGIPEFASHYGKGTWHDISSEMADFSIDDMRRILAKKQVYDTYLSPEVAATALNNEAKRYIKEHQGSFKRFGLFLKDVGISSMSYTADKLNGIAELGRMAQDAFMEKPTVWVDDEGNVLDASQTQLVRGKDGNVYYQGKDGGMHSVHKEQIDYTTLHNMGKNADGSDIKGAFGMDWMTLNPQYWTRAEQFGTLDEDEQKQYEKLGSSPYKVAYNPNEDSDLWYEAFKMMSFGIADAASQLIPYGIGTLGNALSTASKIGRVARGFGKMLDATGKMLTFESKTGQVAQGTAGALGIAYAYNRGAFQETLAQNLANAEEAVNNASKQDIFNQYNKNKHYKEQVDKLINARASLLKNNYLSQLGRDRGRKIVDEKALDRMLHAKAQDAVLGELVQKRIQERKTSKEYGHLQQEAIDGAGDAAFNTFWPEALKYGFVNTLGYRKYLYTNPASLSKKVSSSLKGLKEVTTDAGFKRMTTEPSKFLTMKDKLKQFGKVAASQAWGGAWTNGTDDMQVDAAERINEDSYNRYLHAYQNGEALSDVYGFADGLYSYMKGLGNSLGQETTLNSAIVGGLGSIVNFTPHFANISRFATQKGREEYRNAFRKEIERNEEGTPLRNEDGSVKTKNYGQLHNWRGQLNYFVQNGVLNTYYGNKQHERDLQSHADYVNKLLDDYEDFESIEKLVASNIASENTENFGDQKTISFVKALHAIHTLNNLGNDPKDPTTLSTTVQNAKKLIEKASHLNDEGKENPFSEGEINSLLSQYYASNLGLEQSDANNQKALYNIAQNAQMLQEASDAYDKAEKEIRKIEKNQKNTINPLVREKMKEAQALNAHWLDRKSKMQSEIDDPSTEDAPHDASTLLATVGGIKNGSSLVKVYDRQQAEIEKELEEQKKKTEALRLETAEAQETLKDTTLTSDARYKAEQKLKDAQDKEDSSKQQEDYLEGMLSMTVSKKETLRKGIDTIQREQEESSDKKEKVLTADEIFSLDPVTRARMLSKENRDLYSKEQQREIEKLEQRLLMRDGDSLQKIQDIALLTQRIATNEDAYSRMAKNPNAAAVAVESQREAAAMTAYNLTNQRNAEAFADCIQEFDESMKNHSDVTDEEKGQFVYKQLRRLNTQMLDIIDEGELLPQYPQQVTQAKKWVKTVEDIEAVIANSDKSDEWKNNVLDNVHNLVEEAQDREGILSSLEKVVDDLDKSQASDDFDYLLEGLSKIGYQRDATVLENRKQRKEREAEEKKRQEKAAQEAAEAKASALKKAEEAKANAEPSKETSQESQTLDGDTPADDTAHKDATMTNMRPIDLGLKGKADSKEKDAGKAQGKEETTGKEDKGPSPEESQEKDTTTPKDEPHENNSIIVEEGETKGKSPSLKEQVTQGDLEGKDIQVSDISEASDTPNAITEQVNEANAYSLSGNGMSRYEPQTLESKGKIVLKKGKDANDNMNKYYSWMDAAGIKLQNIIDRELAQIIQRNPHAKIRFMGVKPEDNATHDMDMFKHCMLVLDYDDSINKGITSIHDDTNGGVIESMGKKYLIVGTVGYTKGNKYKQGLWGNLWDAQTLDGLRMTVDRKKFFDAHPNERFYVNDQYSTEVVPYSQIPGYIVRQMEGDENPEYRDVRELLSDRKRNPLGYDMRSVSWGIQEADLFAIAGKNIPIGKVMVPRNVPHNLGSAFVLMPASNGMMVPSYLKVLKYVEMRDGALKDRVQSLLDRATAKGTERSRYDDAIDAINSLCNIFYLSPEGDDIRRKGKTVTLQSNGTPTTFILDDNFDKTKFMQAFADMNPRVNITMEVLSSQKLLERYGEAGALMTDAALFGTAGSSYSIYALDKKGKMMMPTEPINFPVSLPNSGYRKEQGQVIYDHQYYREEDGVFSLDGTVVTDPGLIEQLRYNKGVIDNKLTYVMTDKIWEYYILSSGEHPEAIKVDKNTKKVVSLPEEQAQQLIKKVNEEKAQEEREKAAMEALLSGKEESPQDNMGNMIVWNDGIRVDETTGEIIQDKTPEESPQETAGNRDRKTPPLEDSPAPTQTFIELYNQKSYRMKLMILLSKKWKDIPNTLSEKMEFLRKKNIEVDAIGTSDTAIKAWMDTLENCR